MSVKQVVVVTGGASGIGRAAALKFAVDGAQVVIGDVNDDGGAETVDMIRRAGGQAIFEKTDVSSYEQVEALVEAAAGRYRKVDVMFNNAGFSKESPFIDQDLAQYHQLIAVNQHGVAYGIRAAARKMRETGTRGVIINTSSVFGYLANRGTFGYHAAKGAVIMMTKAAALELAPLGIRVVGIAPGGVDTPILDPLRAAGLMKAVEAYHMRRRLIEPAAIANAVALLASGAADVINGTVVMLDDGFSSYKV